MKPPNVQELHCDGLADYCRLGLMIIASLSVATVDGNLSLGI
jgi:hypothetical protein